MLTLKDMALQRTAPGCGVLCSLPDEDQQCYDRSRKSQDAQNSPFCWEESGGLKGNLTFSFYDLVLFNDALKLYQISFCRPVFYVPSTWVTLYYCIVSQGI